MLLPSLKRISTKQEVEILKEEYSKKITLSNCVSLYFWLTNISSFVEGIRKKVSAKVIERILSQAPDEKGVVPTHITIEDRKVSIVRRVDFSFKGIPEWDAMKSELKKLEKKLIKEGKGVATEIVYPRGN